MVLKFVGIFIISFFFFFSLLDVIFVVIKSGKFRTSKQTPLNDAHAKTKYHHRDIAVINGTWGFIDQGRVRYSIAVYILADSEI